jgi:hypothetical protein
MYIKTDYQLWVRTRLENERSCACAVSYICCSFHSSFITSTTRYPFFGADTSDICGSIFFTQDHHFDTGSVQHDFRIFIFFSIQYPSSSPSFCFPNLRYDRSHHCSRSSSRSSHSTHTHRFAVHLARARIVFNPHCLPIPDLSQRHYSFPSNCWA